MRDRDVAKRKAIKSNNPQDWAMYKRLRNRINGEVKSTKASYYASAFIQSNGDSRKTWQLINELTSRQKNNASVKELKLNENSVTNSHELSNALNDHFSTIGTKLANEVPLVTDGSSYADYIVSSDNKFIFSPISSSTGCPKSSFLYFISLYFCTIELVKQIIETKVVSFNLIHYFHTCCAIF